MFQNKAKDKGNLGWFVLKPNDILFYENSSDAKPKGAFNLKGCTLTKSNKDKDFSFTLSWPDQEEFIIVAASSIERQEVTMTT